MDSIVQVQESGNMMYQLISEQRAAMEQETVDVMMEGGAFSIDRLDAMGASVKLDQQQKGRMKDFQSRQKRYEKEFQELRKKKDTAEGMAAYFEKLIQMEQNTMEMRLFMASLLGEEAVAQRVKAESLERINSYREVVLNYYKTLTGQEKQEERKKQLEEELAKGKEAQREAAVMYDLSVLTAAALDRIEIERREKKDDAALMQEFLAADYSTRMLEAGYVIQNMDTCLHNVELIRRMRRMVFTGDDAAKVIRKLEAVGEYPNVVESTLWEYGLTIDYNALQIRKIDPNDETFAGKRQAFAENGALNFYLDIRSYKQSGGGGEAEDARRQEQTRVEERLSVLEAKLKMADLVGKGMRIMKIHTHSTGAIQTAKDGDIIRATEEEAQGKREHTKVKDRFGKIYAELKKKLTTKLGEDAKAFQDLQTLVDNYVQTNRKIYEDRTGVEQNETKALAALRSALARVQKSVFNKCSKYAAILLGLLTVESNGYLEVPTGEKQVVEDKNIVLNDRKVRGVQEKCTYKDCTDMPLFTHRPNIKDIKQGHLGDCYLLAGLISVVNQNAEEIMNIMRDNGDGTVTVCFKPEETDASGKTGYIPCYTTVRKTVPVFQSNGNDAFSKGALWVKMIEKAYAASGIHLLRKVNASRAKRGVTPLPYRQWQEAIIKGKRKADYDDIKGGTAGRFVSLLIGKNSDGYLPDKNRAEHVGNRIGRWLPPISEPEWEPGFARKFGNKSVDSIVYEFIRKQDQKQAEKFLSLKKPEMQEREDDTLMANYRAEKENLQKYKRICILNLEIMDFIAKEMGTDILNLESKQKIKRWYRKLKAMFAHYKNRKASDPLSRDDEIIDSVRNNYLSPEYSESFLAITVQQFNSTLNILQQRHMALLRENQEKKRRGEAVDVGRERHNYYSARDLKLFGRIEDALRAGSYVAFGTRILSKKESGLNGESEAGGMVGTHAYTIINTRRVMVHNQVRLYLVVMNPWAKKGVVYDVNKDGTRERAVRGKKDGEKEEGVFCLDLQRFAEVVRRWEKVPA